MRPAAIGIIVKDASVLLVKRKDVPVWVLPGGGIDDGETAEQAVVREVFEETGLQVVVVRKMAEYSPINRFTSTAHLFICQQVAGEVQLSDESADVAYFSVNALPRSLFPYHKEWLEGALNLEGDAPVRSEPMSNSTFWRIIGFYLCRPKIAAVYLMKRIGMI